MSMSVQLAERQIENKLVLASQLSCLLPATTVAKLLKKKGGTEREEESSQKKRKK